MHGETHSPQPAHPSPENGVAEAHRRATTELQGVSPEEVFGPQASELFSDFLQYAQRHKESPHLNSKVFPYAKDFEFSTGYKGKGYVLGKYGDSEKVASDDKILVLCEDGMLRSTGVGVLRSPRSIHTERQKGILPPKLRPRALGSLALRGVRPRDTDSTDPTFHPGTVDEKEHRVLFTRRPLEDVLLRAVGYDFRPIDMSNLPAPEETKPEEEQRKHPHAHQDYRSKEKQLRREPANSTPQHNKGATTQDNKGEKTRAPKQPDPWETSLRYVAGEFRKDRDAGIAFPTMSDESIAAMLVRKYNVLEDIAREHRILLAALSTDDRRELEKAALDKVRPTARAIFHQLQVEGIVASEHTSGVGFEVVKNSSDIKEIIRKTRKKNSTK